MRIFNRYIPFSKSNKTEQENSDALGTLSMTYETYEYSQDHMHHFIRRPMGEEGDGIYALYGMSRREAASLMKRHLPEIKKMIAPAIQAALSKNGFVNYLIERGVIPEEKPDEAKSIESKESTGDVSPAKNSINPGKELQEHIKKINKTHKQEQKVREYVKDDDLLEKLVTPVASLMDSLRVQRTLSEEEKVCLPQLDGVYYAYILYDVSLGNVNNGVSPVCMLRALAKLDSRTLCFRSLQDTTNGSGNSAIIVDDYIGFVDNNTGNDEPSASISNEDPSAPLNPTTVNIAAASAENNQPDDLKHILSSFGSHGDEIFLELSTAHQFRRLKSEEQGNKFAICPLPSLSDKSFLAFGATREEVYQLLTADLWVSGSSGDSGVAPKQNSLVKMIIKKALRAALVRGEFYEYLVSDAIPHELKDCIKNRCVNDYLKAGTLPQELQEKLSICKSASKECNILEVLRDHVNPSAEAPAAGRIFFDALETDSVLIHAYLHYDLIQQKVAGGWSDPLVLLAYATLKGIKINIWKRNAWSKGTEDYMNLVPVNFLVDFSKQDARSIRISDENPNDAVLFYDWFVQTRSKITREMNIFFTEGNQFERLENLSQHEYLPKETLVAVHTHKVDSKEAANKQTLARFYYKMTPPEDFDPLASAIFEQKKDELQKFYENTARDSTLNNLWNVLRYLIKDSEIRKKLEIKQLKKLQDIEKTSKDLSDQSGILQRIKGLLEYMCAASELRKQPISMWDSTNDAEKIETLQQVLDKMFKEHQSTLIYEYAGYIAPKDEDLVTDDLQLISKSPKQKTDEYKQIVDGYSLPFTAIQLMVGEGGIQKSIEELTEKIEELGAELGENKDAHDVIAELIGLREASILGRCTNDRIDVDTFLEGKDEFANKYRNDVIQIVGRESVEQFNTIRMQLGLQKGDFLYEFFGKYPPSISPDTIYENGNNLLHIAVNAKNFPLIRGLVVLGVDPAMRNDFDQRPAEMILDTYYARELGALMNMRISLDNQLKKGQAENRAWLQKENALMESFGTYAQQKKAPSPDSIDRERAENDKKKMTIYSPTLYSPVSYLFLQGPGLFYAGMVGRLPTFDQKIDYILSFFRQLISIDKICFLNPFNATLDQLASLLGAIGENVEKLVSVKKSQIELLRLRQLIFDALFRGDKFKDYSNHITETMNLEVSGKGDRSNLSSVDEEACSQAVNTFNNVRLALSIYESIEAQSLARHSVENDLPLVKCIEEIVLKDLKHDSFPIKCYRDIFSEMKELVGKFRDNKVKLGKHPDHTALAELKREFALLVIEHDGFDEKQKDSDARKLPQTAIERQFESGAQDFPSRPQAPYAEIEYRRVHCGEDNGTLFNAVASQMKYIKYGRLLGGDDLKDKVIVHMNENRAPYIAGSIKDDAALSSHLQSIAEGSLAAGKYEIYAIVRLFGLHIHLHQPDGQVDEYGDIESADKIHLGLTNDGFYFSMIPKATPTWQAPVQPTPPLSNSSPSGSRKPPLIFTQKNRGDGQPESSRQGGYQPK